MFLTRSLVESLHQLVVSINNSLGESCIRFPYLLFIQLGTSIFHRTMASIDIWVDVDKSLFID